MFPFRLVNVRGTSPELQTATSCGWPWLKLFNDYDKDGNGELDADEFAVAVRKFVPKSAMSDKELKMFFRSVDEDGGGTIDAVEFESFFFKGELNQRQFFGSMWELAEVWATDDAEEGAVKTFDPERDGAALCGFLQDIYDNITVTKVKQDDGTVVKVKGGDEMRGTSTKTKVRTPRVQALLGE